MFAEKFFPAVFAVGSRWVCGFLGTFRIVGIELIVFRINACGRRVEDLFDPGFIAKVSGVQIDRCGIVNDVRIMRASKDVAGTSHIGCKLVHFVERLIEYFFAHGLQAQVADYKFISFSFVEFRIFEINSANPEPFLFELSDKMSANESSCAAHQCCFLLRHKIKYLVCSGLYHDAIKNRKLIRVFARAACSCTVFSRKS